MKNVLLLLLHWPFWVLGQSAVVGDRPPRVALHILGVTQDAGLPQLGCSKPCCSKDGQLRERTPVVSLGLVQSDPSFSVLLEATPDITNQWQMLTRLNKEVEPSSILITHAHMGHYTGLLQLGREARNTKGVKVYGHKSFTDFLRTNQPWKQLVDLQNITPLALAERAPLIFGDVRFVPLRVPHRDEISATYAYLIEGPSKKALFLPDIDKWDKWGISIDSLVGSVDYAFIDATFFDEVELPGRDLREIPHPTVRETMQRASAWPLALRQKIYLIHFNHTNPLLIAGSEALREVEDFGFRVCRVGEWVAL